MESPQDQIKCFLNNFLLDAGFQMRFGANLTKFQVIGRDHHNDWIQHPLSNCLVSGEVVIIQMKKIVSLHLSFFVSSNVTPSKKLMVYKAEA